MVLLSRWQRQIEPDEPKSCLAADVGEGLGVSWYIYIHDTGNTPELVASLDVLRRPSHHILRSIVPCGALREGCRGVVEAIFARAVARARVESTL